MPSTLETMQRPKTIDPAWAIEHDRRYLPRTLSRLFDVEENEIVSLIRRADIRATGGGEVVGEVWATYARVNRIALTDYGRQVAEARQREANAPAAVPVVRGPTTEAGQQAVAYAKSLASERTNEAAAQWLAYIGLLSKTKRTRDQADSLLAAAAELGRLPQVEADQILVAEIVRLESLVASGARSCPKRTLPRRRNSRRRRRRHKTELNAAWKKMRQAESNASETGEARFTIQKLALTNPEFFQRGSGAVADVAYRITLWVKVDGSSRVPAAGSEFPAVGFSYSGRRVDDGEHAANLLDRITAKHRR